MGLTGFLTATAHGVDIMCQPHGVAHVNDLAVNPVRYTFCPPHGDVWYCCPIAPVKLLVAGGIASWKCFEFNMQICVFGHLAGWKRKLLAYSQPSNNNNNNNNNTRTMFILLPSWQCHCESSLSSFDECKAAPIGRRPSNQANGLGL